MSSSAPRFERVAGVALLAAILALSPTLWSPAAAQATTEQAPLRLDVPFVPTPPEVVARMLEIADVQPSDYLIDLGSGDGRIAIAAVRDRGASGAFGVDINPERVAEARANAEQAGVADKVKFEVQDLFETDFSKASVVSMYLLPNVNIKLRPKILQLKPGTRVVSHAFNMDDWETDASDKVGTRSVYLWVVPAKVDGQWQVSGPDGEFALDLKQAFQKVEGSAKLKGKADAVVTGQLRGETVSFNIDNGGTPQRYIGKVNGDTIVAVNEAGTVQGWQATRR